MTGVRRDRIEEWILEELVEPMARCLLFDRCTADLGAVNLRTFDRALAHLSALGRIVRIGAPFSRWSAYARAGSVFTRNGFDPAPMDTIDTRRRRAYRQERRAATMTAAKRQLEMEMP